MGRIHHYHTYGRHRAMICIELKMKELRLAAACLGVMAVAPLAAARPEPNAFLNRLAPDMKALVVQVQNDPEVYARYAKHFGMSKNELLAYFSTLKPSRIARSGPYVVYNIHDDGIVRSRIFNLKAGSLIYIDSIGTPILKKICGNPMATSPKKLSAVNLIQEAPVSESFRLKPIPEVGPEAATPAELTVAEELAQPPVEATPEITPPVAPPVTETPPVIPEVKPSFEVAPSGNGWILPLLSGAVALAGGGGGGGHSVVPEPTSLAAAGSIVGMWAMSRLRRRRRS